MERLGDRKENLTFDMSFRVAERTRTAVKFKENG